MWAVLGLPCLLFVIGLLGGAMQWCSSCFSQWFSCCMGFWSCTMWWWVFLMMGIHFAFSIALGDMCEVYVTNAYVLTESSLPEGDGGANDGGCWSGWCVCVAR